MLALLLFLIIFLVCFGVGARLLRLFSVLPVANKAGARKSSALTEEFVFATSLGLGLLAYVVLGLGLGRLLYKWTFLALLLLLAVLAWKEIGRLLEGIGQGLKASIKNKKVIPYVSIGLGLWLIPIGCLALIGALAPAAGFDWDGLVYHLAAPKIYLQHHRILPLPWMSHSNFPFVTEMLYLFGLGVQGQELAKLFHFGCGLLLATAIFCWANAAYGRPAGLLAAAIFASIPLVFWESTVAYNELAFALFCTLSLWAWWKSPQGFGDPPMQSGGREEGRAGGWIALSGVFAGLALGTKPLAGFLVIFMLLAILWRKPSKLSGRPHRVAPTILMLWLIPTVLLAAPWYVKSFLWTGNPVYPFFYSLFDGRFWSAGMAHQYAADQAKFGLGHGPQWLLAFPWTLTMYGYHFYDKGTNPLFKSFIAVVGPLFLAFLPIMLLQARRDRLMRYLLAYCGVAAITWFALTQQSRYLLPILPALCLAAAGVIMQAGRGLSRLVGAIVGVELMVGLATGLALVGMQMPEVFHIEPRPDYLSRTLNIYPISRQANAVLPKKARLMLLNDTRGFYLDCDYMWGIGHHNLIPPEEQTSPEALSAALRRLGVTHLLLSPDMRRSIATDAAPLQKSLRELLSQGRQRPVAEDRQWGFAIYALAGP